VPTYKANKTSVQNSGSAPSIILPNVGDGAAVGDYGIIVLATAAGTVTSADPTGWTPLTGSPTTATSGVGRFYVWVKPSLVVGDLGATISFTMSASSRVAIASITSSSAILANSAKDETNSSGLSVVAPSVTPGTASDLLIVIHGVITNGSGSQPTWTPDAATTERVDITTANASARNATLLVATQVLSSSAATGTRTAIPTLDVQRQGISIALSAASLTSVKTGSSASATAAQGIKATEHTKTGSSASGLAAGGSKGVDRFKIGSAAAVMASSGFEEADRLKTGAGTANATCSGSKLVVVEYTKAGSSVSNVFAGGSKEVDLIKTGAAVTAVAASGFEEANRPKTGSGTAAGAATGPKTVISGGTTYTKTGSGATESASCGPKTVDHVQTGSSAVSATASGSKTVTFTKTGSGASGAVSSGPQVKQYTKTGSAVIVAGSSGSRVAQYTKTGAGAAGTTPAGGKIRELAGKTGAAAPAVAVAGSQITINVIPVVWPPHVTTAVLVTAGYATAAH
jgi:hypothetical protein